eukprot:5403512-Amphidinium_carterae.1
MEAGFWDFDIDELILQGVSGNNSSLNCPIHFCMACGFQCSFYGAIQKLTALPTGRNSQTAAQSRSFQPQWLLRVLRKGGKRKGSWEDNLDKYPVGFLSCSHSTCWSPRADYQQWTSL